MPEDVPEETMILQEPEQPKAYLDNMQAPVGFWTDLAEAVRKELKPPVVGFFSASSNAPVKGILEKDRLVLVCANPFAKDIVNKPEVLNLVARKASAKLGGNVRVVITDETARNENNEGMEKLLRFGREHSDIITIKE